MQQVQFGVWDVDLQCFLSIKVVEARLFLTRKGSTAIVHLVSESNVFQTGASRMPQL